MSLAESFDPRFRTCEPTPMRGPYVVDSYTGLMWCGAGLHLLDERNRDNGGGCRPCGARSTRLRRQRTR